MRQAEITRKTTETDILLRLALDGNGSFTGSSGIGFLDHMLHQVARHGGLDLEYRCQGDLFIDTHHTVEDLGICLGQALKAALGDRAGVRRYGAAYVPMDEALARAVLDLSGRPFLAFNGRFPVERIGTLETECIVEFFRAVTGWGGLTLHLDLLAGSNAHHMAEALFKAFGRALREAAERSGSDVPSTKGVLE